jgi:YVTN family beta-propeller protein
MKTPYLAPLAALGLLASVPAHAAPAAPPSYHPYHLLQKVILGGEGGWDYLTVDPDARRLYISRGTHVMVVNADTYKVVGDIPNTNGVHGIAFAPKLGRGFTSNGRDNTVTVFDLKMLKTIGSAPTGDRPDAILYDPASNRVFTFNGGSNDATAIDAATGKAAGTIPLGGRPEFAAADGKGMVYDNIEDKGEVVAIDAKTLTVKKRWPLAPLESPSGLAIDAKNRRLFAVCDGQKMAVINADTGKVVATPAIGSGPDAAGFDPGTGLAFSSNGQDGTLTVVREDSPASYRVAQVVPTQAGARTMALDPKTHRVFLVTAMPGPATPGAPPWRRSYVPGTFTLLVVGP